MNAAELKAIRIDLCVTQESLAERIGVARTTISAWEKGRQPIPPWFGLAVAAAIAGLEPYRPSEQSLSAARRIRRVDSRWMSPVAPERLEDPSFTARHDFDREERRELRREDVLQECLVEMRQA